MKSETRPVVRKNTVVEDFTRLGISAGVAQELSRTCFLGTKARDESGHEFIDIKKRVISQRVQTIPLENLLTSKRIAMVGTAGSGKTMGLVKLALMLKKKKVDVCFSSLDSRKVTSQLEMSQYGKILRVPIKEIDKKSAHEVQLIDTPSLRLDSEESNWLLVKQLGGVPTSVLLCLEATMRLTEMIRVYELTKRFFAVEAFFISKLDLTMLSGAIVDLSVQTRIPICGVNSSQSYNSPLNFYNSTELSDVILQRGAFR